MNDEKYIELGRCTKSHGIKGAFTFVLYNQEDSILKKGFSILLKPFSIESSLPSSGELFEIASISLGNKVIVSLKGISSKTEVDKMIPFTIFASRESFPEADEGEFYISDLVGLTVLDASSKEKLGVIMGTYDNSAQYILKIEGKVQVELPFVDVFFPELNIEEGYILVNLPEEL